MRPSRLLCLAPALLVSVFAGCGGSDDDAGDDDVGTSSSSGTIGSSSSGTVTSSSSSSGESSTSSSSGAASSSSSSGESSTSSSSGEASSSSSSSSGEASSSSSSSSGEASSSSSSGAPFDAGTPDTFTIGGTISGLAGTGLILHLGAQNIAPAPGTTTFQFATAYQTGAPYNVTRLADPSIPTQHCSIARGQDVVGTENVDDIEVTCETQAYKVGGVVTGLPANKTVTLKLGAQTKTLSANDPFTFDTTVLSGTAYAVTITGQPTGSWCTVSNANGTVTDAAVDNLSVSCEAVTSCADISDLDAAAPSGAYGVTLNASVQSVYCDMENDGGGWTLALKADGGSAGNEFAYGSTNWTDAAKAAFGTVDMAQTQAKLVPFTAVAMKETRVVLKTGNVTKAAKLGAAAVGSLQALVTGATTSQTTGLGRAGWFTLVPGAALQPDCNREGYNALGGSSNVRIGIVGNENGPGECTSADSFIGIGGANNCAGTVPSVGAFGCYNSLNAGGAVVVSGGSNAGAGATSFAWVFVR